MQAESANEKPPTDPAIVADAIDSHAREQAYDQVIVGYLLKIAGELRNGEHEDAAILPRRVSGLVRALSYIEERAGVEFDAEVARTFVAMMRKLECQVTPLEERTGEQGQPAACEDRPAAD